MKCYHHINTEAVATCSVCGRALCTKCASLYNIPYCSDCAHQLVWNSKKDTKKAFIEAFLCAIAIIVWQGYSIIVESRFSIEYVLLGILMAALGFCIPFGLRLIDKITFNEIVILPIIIWTLLKFILSFLIGWIALPIYLHRAKQLEKTITEMENMRNL